MVAIVLPSNKVKDATTKDPSLNTKIGPFLSKLRTMSQSSGLHLEHIKGAADPRVRTARVTGSYRAVLFELDGGGEPVYVFHGVWQHDEANKIAETIKVGVNPYNGATEITEVGRPSAADAAAIKRAQDEARDEIARARREAEELAQEAARLHAANDELRRQNEEAARAAGTAPSESAEHPVQVVPAAVPAPITDPAVQWAPEITVETLRDELGIDVRLAAAALATVKESELLDLAGTAEVPWQGDALLALVTGSSIDDVRSTFGLTARADVPAEPTDADLIAGLRTPAARSSFAWLENDDDLRQALEDLSFNEWKLFLHPQQRALVERRLNGAMRISGGAGTGKTVVTVHRAASLAADAGEDHPARILLTTFTRNLADDLKRQLAELAPETTFTSKVGEPGVLVSGLDKVARSILQRAGDEISRSSERVLGLARADVLSYPAREDAIWTDVIDILGDDLPEGLRTVDFLDSEYQLVILANRITSLQDYLRVRRPGRGVALDRRKRAAVWKAVDRYRLRSSELKVASFAEQLTLAADWLDQEAQAGVPRPFDHVLVDEAQDLTPAHLQLLRALVEAGPDDLFLAEDSHQRIYGRKITLSRYGIEVRGRSRRLTRNYRTTRQNLDLAFSILDPGDYVDMEGQGEEHHYLSPRSGPTPILLPAKSPSDELDNAALLLEEWLDADKANGLSSPESIGILVRDRYRRDGVVTGLAERGIEVRAVDREAIKAGMPVVMTMHRAKGLEFRRVLLFDVSKASIPRALRGLDYSEDEASDAMLRERSLLYVAATRARDELAISWNGDESPLLEGVTEQSEIQ